MTTRIIIALDHDGCAEFYTAINSYAEPIVKFRGQLYQHLIAKIRSVIEHYPRAKIYVACFSARQSYLLNYHCSVTNKNISAIHLLKCVALRLAKMFPNNEVYVDMNLLADEEPGEHLQKQLLQELNYQGFVRTLDTKCVLKKARSKNYLSRSEYPREKSEINAKLKLARLRQMLCGFPMSDIVYVFAYDDFLEYLEYVQRVMLRTCHSSVYPNYSLNYFLVDPGGIYQKCRDGEQIYQLPQPENIWPALIPWRPRYDKKRLYERCSSTAEAIQMPRGELASMYRAYQHDSEIGGVYEFDKTPVEKTLGDPHFVNAPVHVSLTELNCKKKGVPRTP